jgi:hypothetical protein
MGPIYYSNLIEGAAGKRERARKKERERERERDIVPLGNTNNILSATQVFYIFFIAMLSVNSDRGDWAANAPDFFLSAIQL